MCRDGGFLAARRQDLTIQARKHEAYLRNERWPPDRSGTVLRRSEAGRSQPFKKFGGIRNAREPSNAWFSPAYEIVSRSDVPQRTAIHPSVRSAMESLESLPRGGTQRQELYSRGLRWRSMQKAVSSHSVEVLRRLWLICPAQYELGCCDVQIRADISGPSLTLDAASWSHPADEKSFLSHAT